MTLSIDRLKILSRRVVLLTLIAAAAVGCDSAPATDGGPNQSPGDAHTDRADATAIDSSSKDQATEDVSFVDGRDGDEKTDRDAGADDGKGTIDARDDDGKGAIDARDDDGEGAIDGREDEGDGEGGFVDVTLADRDGGCECTLDDAGRVGYFPLDCFCGNGGCLGYDLAMSQCPSTPFPEDHRVDTYAGCNLAVIFIANGIGIGGATYVYDATTHDLVGGSSAGDFPASPCGTTQVYGYRAGMFPPPSCPRTSSSPRCLDGGADGG
jgi:hypothetical protein